MSSGRSHGRQLMSDDDRTKEKGSGLSRRGFLKASGISLSVPLVMGHHIVKVAGAEVKVFGPGKAPITLNVNGKNLTAEVEPRVTLLEALRAASREARLRRSGSCR